MPVLDAGLQTYLLAKSPLFVGLALHERLELAAAAAVSAFERGTALFRAGEPADRLHLIFAGRAKQGQKVPRAPGSMVRLLGPGDLCGWPSVVTDELYPTGATALDSTITLCWPRATFTGFMARYAPIPQNAIRMLARSLREQDERYQELASERVPQRLARTLLRLAQSGTQVDGAAGVEVPLSRAELAQLTGTTMFSVSRLLCAWQERGVLGARRGRVVVTDIAALGTIAAESGAPGLDGS